MKKAKHCAQSICYLVSYIWVIIIPINIIYCNRYYDATRKFITSRERAYNWVKEKFMDKGDI